MVNQFILELKLQTSFIHENLLTLYTQFDDKDHLYLVLEYMEEGTLFNYLKKYKKLPEVEVATKIRQIASAVKYLHEN
jgi:serine/threonine protein kinase